MRAMLAKTIDETVRLQCFEPTLMHGDRANRTHNRVADRQEVTSTSLHYCLHLMTVS